MKEHQSDPLKVQEPDLTGSYSAREYLTWKTEELMELIRGKIFKMSPAPSSRHQRISMELGTVLNLHFRSGCLVYPAPFDVYLTLSAEDWKQTNNIVQPDLCVICDPAKIHEHGCIGAPDLVVEILSPSTAAKDTGAKRELYEHYGVKELWIVHPQEGTVLVHVLEKGSYRILPLVARGKILQSPTFPTLKVDLDEVFIE